MKNCDGRCWFVGGAGQGRNGPPQSKQRDCSEGGYSSRLGFMLRPGLDRDLAQQVKRPGSRFSSALMVILEIIDV
jgi:hypothetical protein